MVIDGILWDLMVIEWDLVGLNGDWMVIEWDLVGFNGDWMGFSGI